MTDWLLAGGSVISFRGPALGAFVGCEHPFIWYPDDEPGPALTRKMRRMLMASASPTAMEFGRQAFDAFGLLRPTQDGGGYFGEWFGPRWTLDAVETAKRFPAGDGIVVDEKLDARTHVVVPRMS